MYGYIRNLRRALGKEVVGTLRKGVEEVFIDLEFEVFAIDYHRDDLNVVQFWCESRMTRAVDSTAFCTRRLPDNKQ